MSGEYFDLSADNILSLIRERFIASGEGENSESLNIEFSHGSVKRQLRRFERVLHVIGGRIKTIGLLMIGLMNDADSNMAAINSIVLNCPNLKELYAAALCINDEDSLTMRPFFGRLEKIELQTFFLKCSNNIFADCKNLKELSLKIGYNFDGARLNFNFPELRLINFSKVDGIDDRHVNRFLTKNSQLKNIQLTRCAITPKILKCIAAHVPNIEELTFNFRRAIVKKSDMIENLKYLLELQQLRTLNLDCCGIQVAHYLMEMTERKIPLQRVGLFCCPWENQFVTAFANIKDLKSLNLTNITGLTDEYLECFSNSLSQLTDLTLKYNKNTSIVGVIKLVRNVNLLTTINLSLDKMSINAELYDLLLEAVKERPEKCKLTITLWGLKHSVKVSKDLLKKNVDFLEIISEEDEFNHNTEFDFYSGTGDGGYDLVTFSPNCNQS